LTPLQAMFGFLKIGSLSNGFKTCSRLDQDLIDAPMLILVPHLGTRKCSRLGTLTPPIRTAANNYIAHLPVILYHLMLLGEQVRWVALTRKEANVNLICTTGLAHPKFTNVHMTEFLRHAAGIAPFDST